MSSEQQSLPGRSRPRFLAGLIRKGWRWFVGLLAILLTYFALKDASWAEVWTLVGGLDIEAVFVIFLVNVLMIPLMTARWWFILRLLKVPVSLIAVSLYRCSSNTASYLTPGPHFGGEPLMVFYLHRFHGLAIPTATTSVVLDRLLELLASIVVLTLCLLLLSRNGEVFGGGWGDIVLIIAVLALFGFVLIALFTGRRPLSRLITLLHRGVGHLFKGMLLRQGDFIRGIERSEGLAESLFRNHRGSLLAANLLSVAHWLGIFAEFWIMAALLGRELSLIQLCAVVMVARLAFYSPLPAGIGVLELALPHVTMILGLGGSLGLGLCLIIRFRDLVFSLAGVGITLKYLSVSYKATKAGGETS